MSQDSSKQIKDYHTPLLSIILILGGALLIFVGHQFAADSLWRKFFESIGVVIASVFTISLLYEKFLAEKHLRRFGENLKQQMRQLESLSSQQIKQ